MSKLNPEVVHDLFIDTIFRNHEVKDGKPILDPVFAEGVVLKAGFHPWRLDDNKPKILELLNELHSNFKLGWTFGNMDTDKHGNQWTGEHRTMDQLLTLGLAAGYMEYCGDRAMFPIGFEYIKFVGELNEN